MIRPAPPPPLPHPHIHRPRLFGQMLRSRVTLLAAPAGYGKSTLLAEALHATDEAKVWYALRASDRDPGRLLTGLAVALGAPLPASGGAADLFQWLERSGRPTTIAIDGVEMLAGADGLLGEFVAGVPTGVRVLLAGRSMPVMPGLASLRLQGAVTDLGARDLLFTEAESEAFLAQVVGGCHAGSPADGWPAALRLLGRTPESSWPVLSGYIDSEVISGLTPVDLEHLTDLAAVDDWSPRACAALLARSDGAEMLRACEQLLPVEQHGRIHPLVRRWFGIRLASDPGRSRAVHRRVALWKAEQGEPETALSHALAAHDLGLAVPLLHRVATRLLAESRTEVLDQLLEQVPDAILEAVPEVLLQAGEALRRAGSPRRASRWLRTAAVGFAAAGDSGGLYRTFCRSALAHADFGEWSEMEAALKQVEAEAEGASGLDRAEALRTLAEYEIHAGQSESAARRLREASELYRAHSDAEGAGIALTGLGAEALVALERLPEALAALREAQRVVGGATACEALLAEAQILTHLGQWEEAEAVLGGAMPDGAQQQASVALLRACLALHGGDLAGAKRFKADGEESVLPADPRPALQGLITLLEGWIAMAEGRTAVAIALGRQTARAAFRGFPLLRLSARSLVEAAEQRLGTACAVAAAEAPTGRLRVECFGAFRLFAGEQEVAVSHWRRAQVRGILQYLLLQPGFAAPREVLLEAFWPEEPPTTSRARLRVALNRLRQALQQLGCGLETGTDIIRLPGAAIAWVDVVVFREHLAAARHLAREQPEAALALCRAGRALYRGELLGDAAWPGIEAYRAEAQRELVELLQLWQATAQRAGRDDEAISALEGLLAIDPGQEEAACQLISLLTRAGRRGEAIRRYRELVQWLKEELGLDPTPRTRELIRQILK